jgi:hypothetical protein
MQILDVWTKGKIMRFGGMMRLKLSTKAHQMFMAHHSPFEFIFLFFLASLFCSGSASSPNAHASFFLGFSAVNRLMGRSNVEGGGKRRGRREEADGKGDSNLLIIAFQFQIIPSHSFLQMMG